MSTTAQALDARRPAMGGPLYLDGIEVAHRLGLLIRTRTASARRSKAVQVRRNLGEPGHLAMERRGRLPLYRAESVDRLLARIRAGEVAIDMQGRLHALRNL
jgi:hypothetical protein